MRGTLLVCTGGAIAMCCGPAPFAPVGGPARFVLPAEATDVRAEASIGTPDLTRVRFEVASVDAAEAFAGNQGCRTAPVEGPMFPDDPCAPDWWQPAGTIGCRVNGRVERTILIDAQPMRPVVWLSGSGW